MRMSTSVVHFSFLVLASCAVLSACGQSTTSTIDARPLASVSPEFTQSDPIVADVAVTEAPRPDLSQDLECIRVFAGDPDLEVEFREATLMINSPSADVEVRVYQDGWGRSYSLDPSLCEVVEFSFEGAQPPLGEPMTLAELRAMAEALFDQYAVANAISDADLVYEEAIKNEENYFFRWQAVDADWLYNPPIFQVGLRVDGLMIFYLNSLAYH
jgi:hypothetical protein